MRIITYDLEVAKHIDCKRAGCDCEKLSWGDAGRGKAGLSSLVLYDTATSRYHIYDDNRTDEMIGHLNEADLLLGFNNIQFDKPAIEGHTNQRLIPKQFDILQTIRSANGGKFVKGYRLGDICERTLGLEKSGDGALAPDLFQRGHFAELHDYNLNDVYLTRTLFNFIVEHGFIIGVNGEPLELAGYPTERA